MTRQLFSLILFITYLGVHAQSDKILGQWKTIDDNTGKERSIVEIYQKNGKYFGKILKIFDPPPDDPDPVCDQCPDDDPRFNQKVVGMEIIKNMEYDVDDKEFENGNILDPENGSIYDCKLWIEEGKLMVRGYILFLYRTQTWYPYNP